MPIPALDAYGLLPNGIHDCTLEEIDEVLANNLHRKRLYRKLVRCIELEIRPHFAEPLLVNGSFATSAELPNDVDVALDLREAPVESQVKALRFKGAHGGRLASEYDVDFLVNLPGGDDFSMFFQRVRARTAQFLGLDPSHRKGILRIR